MEIFILIILVLCSSFFSGAEIAFFSLSEVSLRKMIEEKRKGAKLVEKLKKDPHRLLTTLLIGNNIVNIWASALATVLAIDFFGDKGAAIAVGGMTFILLVFGEITPKSLSVIYNKKISALAATPIWYLSYILLPFLFFFKLINQVIHKFLHNKEEEDFEENVRMMAKIGVEKGSMERGEKDFIDRIFAFNDITAEDVMTVRNKIVAWKATDKISEALNYLSVSSFSRIPVYEDRLDNIIGIVFMKDIIKAMVNNNQDVLLKDIARQPFFIPLNRKIDDLMKDFQKKRQHMGVVIDEHGSVQGVVTLEDLLEELVGEIIDETDVEENLIKRIDKRTVVVDGSVEVEDVNDFLNIDLIAPKGHNIAWLILDRTEEIPKVGQAILFDDVKLIIEEADERRIKKIKIIK